MWAPLGQAISLAPKYWTRVEIEISEKHGSLLHRNIKVHQYGVIVRGPNIKVGTKVSAPGDRILTNIYGKNSKPQ